MTTIELKEQMKFLRQQEREAKKEIAKIKKEYLYWKELIAKNSVFFSVYNLFDKYDSFEELIVDNNWTNTKYSKVEWEFLFNELKYSDTDFFAAFMNWKPNMFNVPLIDRKCSICMDWYNDIKVRTKFKNCDHYCCELCYNKLRKESDGFKRCIICRESERPKTILKI